MTQRFRRSAGAPSWQHLPTRYEWDRRHAVARDVFVPWVEAAIDLRGRTVVEFGCGAGPVAAAFAPGCGRYVGLDIDAEAVAVGREALAEHGLAPELVVAPPERILDALRGLAGEADVLLCYAVLEHLALDERLALLEAAGEVLGADGHLVVIETPNRLTPWDHHTSGLPFFDQLPDALALRYAGRSEREGFAAVTAAELPRWGRGVSYHDLEVALGDLSGRVLAGGWDAGLLEERPIARDELALHEVLEAARPDVHAAFARSWLDLVVAMAPAEPRPQLRPWTLRTDGTARVAYSAGLIMVDAAGTPVRVTLPAPTRRMVVGVETATGFELRDDATDATVRAERGSREGTFFGAVTLPVPASSVTVALDGPGAISCVLYER